MQAGNLKILDVSPRANWPPHRGSQVRTFNLMLHLSTNNLVQQFSQSAVASTWKGPWIERIPLSKSYQEIRFRNPLACRVSEYFSDSWIKAPILSGIPLFFLRPSVLRSLLKWADVIFVEFPWQFEFCWRYHRKNLLVYASHNVEALKFASYATAAEIGKKGRSWLRYIEKLERCAAIRADVITTVSEADKQEFIARYRVAAEKILVVPNGADTDRYTPHSSNSRSHQKQILGLPDRPTAIFIGGSSAAPQTAGFDWIKRLAERLTNMTFIVVGAVSSRSYVHSNLVVTGEVKDHRPYLRAADFSICPIEYGGGTKIKLFEAFSSGLPTIAFSSSVHGVDVRHGEHLLLVQPNVEGLMTAACQLAHDPYLSSRLGQAARMYAVLHHDWRRIATQLEAQIQRLQTRRSL